VVTGVLMLGYVLLRPQWPDALYHTPLASALFAKDGRLLDVHIASDEQWRLPSTDNELPTRYQLALLAFEDQRFFAHPGIDPLALLRAIGQNLRHGEIRSGASTLTMQVARLLRQQSHINNKLAMAEPSSTDPQSQAETTPPTSLAKTPHSTERHKNPQTELQTTVRPTEQQTTVRPTEQQTTQRRGWREKWQESLLTLQLEWHFDKTQILQLYSQHAPFGGNIVGLSSASWWYFQRPPAELSWAEAALLAVLPNSPGLLRPGRKSAQLQQKRDRLLHKLAERGHLNDQDLALALLEPLPSKPQGWPAQTPHLLQTLRQQQPDSAAFYTDIDADLQQQLQLMLAKHAPSLARYGVDHSALMVFDHQHMQLVAYIGNQSHSGQQHAVDIAQRPRSTGSILKPFLYASMLDAGLLLPSALVPDIPSQFDGYQPQNADHQYRGAVRADRALALSLNIPAVRQLQRYGVARFQLQLQQLGLSQIQRHAEHYGLSLILGGAEASLFELTRAYAMLTNHAFAAPTATNTKQPQSAAAVPSLSPPYQALRSAFPLSQGASWLTLQALQDVERPEQEGFWREFVAQQPIAWKTGTSFGLRDGWAIGSNARFTVGVWTGNANGRPAAVLTGAGTAGPLLFDAFALLPALAWPDTPWSALKAVNVCQTDGWPQRHQCPTAQTWLPHDSQVPVAMSYQTPLYVTLDGRYQLPPGCLPGHARQHSAQLQLPLAMRWYAERADSGITLQPPLPLHPACQSMAPQHEMLSLLYPSEGASIRLPLTSTGERGAMVATALHQDASVTLDWYLNGQWLASTQAPHQVALSPMPGRHTLLISAQPRHVAEKTGPATAQDAEASHIIRSFMVRDD
jgi:penicillin-binding protein 1C